MQRYLLPDDFRGEVPGGFYDATNVRPTSVQRINGRVPYYLVQMTGNVVGTAQTLYAAVLDDGRVVRPVPVTRYAHDSVDQHRANLAGSRGKKKSKPRVRAGEEAGGGREMGGAGLKKKLGISEEKSSE